MLNLTITLIVKSEIKPKILVQQVGTEYRLLKKIYTPKQILIEFS